MYHSSSRTIDLAPMGGRVTDDDDDDVIVAAAIYGAPYVLNPADAAM